MPTPSELGIIPQEREPMPSRYALAIPGQGALNVGAGRADYERSVDARETLDYADSYLSSRGLGSVKSLLFEGPQEALSTTENAHLALTALSVAKYSELEARHDFVKPTAIAPQSASECPALAITNVVPFDTALDIAEARGEFTAEAGKRHPGGMLWLTDISGGLESLDDYVKNAQDSGVLAVSNINADNEFVVSGDIESVRRLDKALEGATRSKQILPISFASHCALMEEAKDQFTNFLKGINFRNPEIPIIINGDIVVNGEELKRMMSEGMTLPVIWTDTVKTLDRNNVHHIIELSTKLDNKPSLARSTKNISGVSRKFTTEAI